MVFIEPNQIPNPREAAIFFEQNISGSARHSSAREKNGSTFVSVRAAMP